MSLPDAPLPVADADALEPKPLLGRDLDALRRRLARGGRPLSTQELMNEFALQRLRITRFLKGRDQPLMAPKVEILTRLLQRYPDLSISGEDPLPQIVLDLLNSVRPSRQHTIRDLAVLLGYEASASHAWTAGRGMVGTSRRLLRALCKGLLERPPEGREAFLKDFENIVICTAQSHGIDRDTLFERGFTGSRERTQQRIHSVSESRS